MGLAKELTDMRYVSVIIPTLNEGKNIDHLLSSVLESCSSKSYDLEVIVVDDGSTDGTREAVTKRQSDRRIRLICREDKKGLSSAIVEGAQSAKGAVVVVMDADFSHPPEAVPELIAPVLAGTHDIAIGSRYVSGGSTPGWSLFRLFSSRFATLLAWPFTNVHDPMSGFFAVRKERLACLRKEVQGFKIGLELLAAGGESLRAVEIPIEFHDRQFGQSKLGGRIILHYLRQLLALTGGNVSVTNGSRFILVGLLGLLTDFSIFQFLLSKGVSLGAAHTASFFAATIINYILNARWSFVKENGEPLHLTVRQYMAFLIVALLALFMRGGILASLTRLGHWPAQVAILAAIGGAAVVNYLGSAFFVFAQEGAVTEGNLRWRVLALGLVAYSLVLRLVYLGTPELLQEEAYYWNYAQHLDIGYLDHPPMVAGLIWLGTKVLGNTEFAIRVGALICWLVTALFSYRLTRKIFDKSAAFRAVLLVAILPFFFGSGLVMTPDAPLTACWAGALYFLYCALIHEQRHAWIGAGICLGLGMLSKYTIALLGPAALLFLLVDRRSRRWLLRPEPYISLLVAALLFSPVIAWNAQHDWASFAFQGPRRLQASFDFSVHQLMGNILLLITPTAFMTVAAIIISGRVHKSKVHSVLEPALKRRHNFSLVFSLFPLSIFIIFSLFRSVKLNWTGPLWLVILPFVAYYMVPQTHIHARRLLSFVQRLWPATVVALMLLYGVTLHYLDLGLPGVPYPMDFSLLGWRDLGERIEQIEDEIEHATGLEPLVVGMDKYKTASGLAFYRTQALEDLNDRRENEAVLETASSSLFGKDALMYRYWFPNATQVNRLMILVSKKRGELMRDAVLSWTQQIGEIQEIIIKKNGMPVGRYYYMIAEGYRNG